MPSVKDQPKTRFPSEVSTPRSTRLPTYLLKSLSLPTNARDTARQRKSQELLLFLGSLFLLLCFSWLVVLGVWSSGLHQQTCISSAVCIIQQERPRSLLQPFPLSSRQPFLPKVINRPVLIYQQYQFTQQAIKLWAITRYHCHASFNVSSSHQFASKNPPPTSPLPGSVDASRPRPARTQSKKDPSI